MKSKILSFDLSAYRETGAAHLREAPASFLNVCICIKLSSIWSAVVMMRADA